MDDETRLKINALSYKQLETLCSDTEKLDVFFKQSTSVFTQLTELNELDGKLKSLAESNLSLEPTLNKTLLERDLLYNELKHLEYNLGKIVNEKTILTKRFDPQQIKKRLLLERSKLNKEANKLVEQISNGEIAMDFFIREFSKTKEMVYHYDIKLDKIDGHTKIYPKLV